mgnify:CR=1 FL=1
MFRLARRAGCPLWLAGALGGLIGDVLTYLLAGLSLSSALINAPTPKFTFSGYLTAIYAAYLPIQGPIAIGEMLITGLALHYIYQQRPGILASLKVIPVEKAVLTTVLVFILCAGLAWPSAAQSPAPEQPTTSPATVSPKPAGMPGMDESVNEKMAEHAGRAPRDPYINTEAMGDLWNFILLGAGAVCGFIIGRWWHLLFGGRKAEGGGEPLPPGRKAP